MKNLLLMFVLLPFLASAQQENKEMRLSDTFGECVTAGARIPTKKSSCRFNDNTVFTPHVINDSIVYAVKIAVEAKKDLKHLNGYPEGSLFLTPHDKLFYRYNANHITPCDLDTSQYLVILPWKTSLQETLEEQKNYMSKTCRPEIMQGTESAFKVTVDGVSRKKIKR